MKLFVCAFLILLVMEEHNCAPAIDYSSYPMGRRWMITDCGFGYPHYHYSQYLRPPYYYYYYDDWLGDPYYYDSDDYNTQDYKEIDLISKFLDKDLNKPTEKSLDKHSDKPSDKTLGKPSDKSLDNPSPKPLGKSSDKPSDKPSSKPLSKSSDQLLDESLIPPMGDIQSESIADIDLPNEPLDENL